jgi:heme-binding NEAT domain protein
MKCVVSSHLSNYFTTPLNLLLNSGGCSIKLLTNYTKTIKGLAVKLSDSMRRKLIALKTRPTVN